VFRRNRREDADQSRPGSGAEPDQQDLDELDDDQPDDDQPDDDEPDDDELAYDEPDDDELAYDEPDDDAAEAEDEDDDEPAVSRGAAARARRSAGRRDTDLGDPATWTRLRDSAAARSAGSQDTGPWDAAAGYPDGERMDFGSLLVPMREGFDIQVNLDEDAGIWIAVVYGDSALQLQAFAAPKTSGLWKDVRQEIAAEVEKSGGHSEAGEGPFGAELTARLTAAGQPPQWLRFMGADGPRWFLRGLLTGPAAADLDVARPFEEVFADVVVVRGDHAEPPRKALDIQLPEEARQAIEEQMETEGDGMPNPFERGPEITEIR
jgi:Protein of unknown function (DUF3710)